MTHLDIFTTFTSQKFVFGNADQTLLAVVDIHEIVSVGTPVDPDGGDDLQFIGITSSDITNGYYGEGHEPFTINKPLVTYACVYTSTEEDGGRGDRSPTTFWVGLCEEECKELSNIAEAMQDKHIIEGFTLVAGQPPAGTDFHSLRYIIDDLAGTAIGILEWGGNLSEQDWKEVAEYFEPYTGCKLLQAIADNFSDKE